MSSVSDQENIVYIGLGYDCAVAHNLRKICQDSFAYPFDWIKSDKLSMLCDTLDNRFSNFFEDITQIKQSDNFMNFDENIKSNVKIKLKNGMIFPHEAILEEFNFDKYKEKYMRRIERFNNICTNKNIKKIFIRADNKKITENNKIELKESLNKYGCVNYDIIFITYSDYPIVGEFTWQREYIDWQKIYHKK